MREVGVVCCVLYEVVNNEEEGERERGDTDEAGFLEIPR
jgi:hypothetical protein